MIHSRPGYQTRVTTEGRREPPPAKVNADMEPAILKHSRATVDAKSPLKNAELPGLPVERMQAEAEAAWARMKAQIPQGTIAPEVLLNPTPSPVPVITSPHQE